MREYLNLNKRETWTYFIIFIYLKTSNCVIKHTLGYVARIGNKVFFRKLWLACVANKLSIKIYFMGDACRSYGQEQSLYCSSSLHLATNLSSKVSLYQVWKKYVFSVYLLPNDPYMWYILEAEISSFNLNWPMPAKYRNLSRIWAESGL